MSLLAEARNHSENLLLAASALSWAVCQVPVHAELSHLLWVPLQVLYWDMPVQRAVAVNSSESSSLPSSSITPTSLGCARLSSWFARTSDGSR